MTPDWEGAKGLANDIFAATEDVSQTTLRGQFCEDPWALDVIHYITGDTTSFTVSERCGLCHKVVGFSIEGRKLWWTSTKTSDRTAQTECVPSSEGLLRAAQAHGMDTLLGTTHGYTFRMHISGPHYIQIRYEQSWNALDARVSAHNTSTHYYNLSNAVNPSTSSVVTTYPYQLAKAASRSSC